MKLGKYFLTAREISALHGVALDYVAQQCDVGHLTAYSLQTGKPVLAPQQCYCEYRFENELHFQIIPPSNGFFCSVSSSILDFCDFEVKLATGRMRWGDWKISSEVYEGLPLLRKQGRALFEAEAERIAMYKIASGRYGEQFILVHNCLHDDANNKNKIISVDKIVFKIKKFSENINTSFLCMYNDGIRRSIKEHKIEISIKKINKYGHTRYIIKESSDNIIFNYNVLASALCDEKYIKSKYKEYTRSMFYLHQHYLDVYSPDDRTRRLIHGEDFFYFNYEMFKNLLLPMVAEKAIKEKYYEILGEFYFKRTDASDLFAFNRKCNLIMKDPKEFMLNELRILVKQHPKKDFILFYKLVIEGNTGEEAYKKIYQQGKKDSEAGSEARSTASKKCQQFFDNAHKYKLPAISAQSLKNMDNTTQNSIAADMLEQMHTIYERLGKEERLASEGD